MVRLSKQNPKYSFIKMPNPSYTLNIVQKIGSIKIDDYVHLMIIKNEVFSLMKEIKHLDLEALETASYKIKSNSLKGLANLENLFIGSNTLKNKNIFSYLPNLQHLEFAIERTEDFSSDAFEGLSRLVTLSILGPNLGNYGEDNFVDFSF